MIDFKLIKKKAGRIGLMVRGHANYVKHGDDIVCAAVSSTCFTAINGCLKEVHRDDKQIDITACRPGHFVFTVKDMPTTRALIDATYLHLQGIKKQYPQCFKAE